MATTNVDGLRIGFEIVGDGDRPWVLTPGGRFAREIKGLPELAHAIAAVGNNRVLLWDRPNCGESDIRFSGPNESQMQSEILPGLLDHLDMAPAIVAGGSAGARVSLMAVADVPEIASGLALWWISGRPMELFLLGYLYEVGLIRAAWEDGMQAVADHPEWSLQTTRNPGNRQIILNQDRDEFIATMERWATSFSPRDDEHVPGLSNDAVRKITIPVLVINSETSDANHPRSTTEGIAALLPNGRLEEPIWGDGREWVKRSKENLEVGSVFVGWPALAPQLVKWADSIRG
jgi:pimeloyl-ACP methyl ester carboxylesterase